jgi:hypothetical protein
MQEGGMRDLASSDGCNLDATVAYEKASPKEVVRKGKGAGISPEDSTSLVYCSCTAGSGNPYGNHSNVVSKQGPVQ